MIKLIGVVSGCLLLLRVSAAAEQTQASQAPVISAPLPVPPLPVPPLLVKPMADQPVRVEPLADPRPGAKQVPPSTVNVATAPYIHPLIVPAQPPPPPPPLGNELRNRLKVDEQHFAEKGATAKSAFDLRETEEKKAFEATLLDKGFWERRRLSRAFRAERAIRARAFNDEQEAKRRTYEWRYP